MNRRTRLPAALLAACLSFAAQAQVDLSALDDAMPGPRTQVLVLGTVHLAQGDDADRFDPASLASLLQRLEAFRPEIITVEAMPGETCDLMARHPTTYDMQVGAHFCPDTAAAKAATGLDVPAAIAAVGRQLAAWPDAPAPAQRRHLAALFLASGDPASALVQWLSLPEAERVAGDGLDAALVDTLRERAAFAGETTQIAAALAVRLGLQRVHPADDHTGDALRIDDLEGFEKAIRGARDRGRPQCAAQRDRERALRAQPDLLPLYRLVNSAGYMRAASRCDFGAALQDDSPQRHGRQYVAGWDLRNLRMVANIGTTFRDRPGARVLSIVGASHKPWFDALLGRLQGVDVVDTEAFLAER